MGLIVDKPELLAALDRSDRDIRSQQAEAGRAMSALDGLAGDASLDGRGWQAAKLHAADAARPRLEAAVRQGDRVMADNREFRMRLESLIEDDYLDEDGIADCVRRLRRNDGLLRQAQDLLPADGGPLKGLIDQLRQQGEQQADRLEDKIQRLHTLDQTTRNLYQDTATPQPGNDTNLDGDANALMAKVVNGKMNRKQLTDFFEKKMHMSHKDAAELAYFTMRFRTYAKNKKFSSKQAVYEYVRILASVSYNSRIWRTAGEPTRTTSSLASLREWVIPMKLQKNSSRIWTRCIVQMEGAETVSISSI
ncbi:hypothetical protein OZX74_04705 [Bifidobacterium sp. ESL0798]|uniref:hypothetical protein n=1 Tax=Bifidobacterium sp. ESL0798 TaxID=2983235 RepID=UPI0023F63E22|nr:hypothetical protein [Bifidobacterium sp. ESL0798]WEV74807.1 hypothetical protein OZX74_04705 [Bifidobacterium sp. ESL0798]